MKICFVGPANSAHIIKWCDWFVKHDHEVHVISFTPGEIEGTSIHLIDLGVDTDGSDFEKIRYLFTGPKIKQIIRQIQPDVINAHYATSYGVAMALSGIKGYVLSVWGSDIYDFPRKSFLHQAMLRFSLKRAGHLFSTSQAMADEAGKYTKRQFEITPFGVDMELFNPDKRTRTEDIPFTIGTVKTLAELYGIDYILKAVAIVRKENPDLALSLRISGDGPKEKEYKELAKTLGIDDITVFRGRISQEEAAAEWANMDVAVIPSILYESFGVAAVEAQACGVPVIISDVGGLMETTVPGRSSMVVPRRDENAIAKAITAIYQDRDMRRLMGTEGRRNVTEKYELNLCFSQIEHKLSLLCIKT